MSDTMLMSKKKKKKKNDREKKTRSKRKRPGGEETVRESATRKRKSTRGGGVSSNWNAIKNHIAPSNPKFREKLNHRRQKKQEEDREFGRGKGTFEKRGRAGEDFSAVIVSENDILAKTLARHPTFVGQENIYALDCEMVGVGHDDRSILARCTVVDGRGRVVYDKHVKPMKGQTVTNYRTHVSGIRAKDIRWNSDAVDFRTAQREVSDILKSRVVVGHSLKNDFRALMLNHPPNLIRDTAKFKPLLRARKQGSFRVKHRPQKLKKLSKEILGVAIQEGEHDSAADARAALLLYYKYRKEWEQSLKRKYRARKK